MTKRNEARILLLAIASGALADRVPKRRLLVATQTALGCQALVAAHGAQAAVARGRSVLAAADEG